MESICCRAMTENGIVVAVYTRITAMSSTFKKGLIGLMVAGASLLPFNRAAAQAGPNPGGGTKDKIENVIQNPEFASALKAKRYARENNAIGVAIGKGQDAASWTDDELKAKLKGYTNKSGTRAEFFIVPIQSGESRVMVYVGPECLTQNDVSMTEFMRVTMPAAISRYKELYGVENKLTVR